MIFTKKIAKIKWYLQLMIHTWARFNLIKTRIEMDQTLIPKRMSWLTYSTIKEHLNTVQSQVKMILRRETFMREISTSMKALIKLKTKWEQILQSISTISNQVIVNMGNQVDKISTRTSRSKLHMTDWHLSFNLEVRQMIKI